MLLATFSFSVMGLCVKLNSSSFNEYELVFYRSFVSLIIIIVLMKKNGITIKTKYAWFHFLRSFIGFISLLLFFYAITKLPLSTSMTLNYTSPIFLGLLIPFLMKQKFNSSKLFLLLIGFLGIVFILKPVLNQNWFAGLMGVLSGFGAAIAYIMVAKLGQLKEPDLRTVYFFTLISSILSFGLMLKEDISPISIDINLIYLLLLGVSATITQLSGENDPTEVLSDREFEVFISLAKGKSTNEIADTMCLSPRTVGTHLYNIKQKLNANNSAEIALIAIRCGLLEP